ncbi:MAG: hypothetical protein EXS19_06550 [Pedosphaera sp.]|nr:hypothetical protein [Pedosphaera sp.]
MFTVSDPLPKALPEAFTWVFPPVEVPTPVEGAPAEITRVETRVVLRVALEEVVGVRSAMRWGAVDTKVPAESRKFTRTYPTVEAVEVVVATGA